MRATVGDVDERKSTVHRCGVGTERSDLVEQNRIQDKTEMQGESWWLTWSRWLAGWLALMSVWLARHGGKEKAN